MSMNVTDESYDNVVKTSSKSRVQQYLHYRTAYRAFCSLNSRVCVADVCSVLVEFFVFCVLLNTHKGMRVESFVQSRSVVWFALSVP